LAHSWGTLGSVIDPGRTLVFGLFDRCLVASFKATAFAAFELLVVGFAFLFEYIQ